MDDEKLEPGCFYIRAGNRTELDIQFLKILRDHAPANKSEFLKRAVVERYQGVGREVEKENRQDSENNIVESLEKRIRVLEERVSKGPISVFTPPPVKAPASASEEEMRKAEELAAALDEAF